MSFLTDGLRVTVCDTEEKLAAAGVLFNAYRHHYGEPAAADMRAIGWLTSMVRADMLSVYTVSSVGQENPPPIGLATSHVVPASLVMGRFWQIRDLYILPEHRRRGAAAALVSAIRDAAHSAGATRLSLATELGNQAARDLYRRLGFTEVEGLVSLNLGLATEQRGM